MATTAPQQTAAPSKHFGRMQRRDNMTGYLFILPYLLTASVFTLGLLVYAFYTSFTDLRASYQQAAPSFIGFANYTRALTDPDFLNSLSNIVWYALIVTTFQTIFAILIAVLLNTKLRGMQFFRTAIYSPSVASSVVISLIFLWLFLRTGFINYIFGTNLAWLTTPDRIFDGLLTSLGYDKLKIASFVRGPSVAWCSIMAMNIFTTIPTFMVMFLAALQDIPEMLYEAGEIDGADGWKAFLYITLPMLRPVVTLVVVLGTIGTFQIFDQVAIISKGGPLKTTQVPAYYIYEKTLGTGTQAEAGYAAAMAFILATIIIIITIIQRRYIEPRAER